MREQELPLPDRITETRREAGKPADVDSLLGSDEAALAAVAAWQRQNDPLRLLEHGALEEAVPVTVVPDAGAPAPATVPGTRLPRPLQAVFSHVDAALGSLARAVEHTVERLFGTPVEHSLIPQALAIALVLALGVGTGWFGHRAWASRAEPARSAGEGPDQAAGAGPGAATADTLAPASVARGLMREAMTAHGVYGGEPRHNVEVTAAEQEELLRWLGRQLGRTVQPPALADLGWKLAGGRLLPGQTSGAGPARAQFTYLNKAGQRLTLYLGVLDPGVAARARQRSAAPAQPASTGPARAAGSGDGGNTTFSYTSQAQLHASHWTVGQFGCTLVGELPRAALEKIGVEVYLQMVGLGGMDGKR
ncbi:MAG: hypothetical protein RLZZ584_3288 [Pseudomonadota bacterium]|jgi:anti-sigma factor RsiW